MQLRNELEPGGIDDVLAELKSSSQSLLDASRNVSDDNQSRVIRRQRETVLLYLIRHIDDQLGDSECQDDNKDLRSSFCETLIEVRY